MHDFRYTSPETVDEVCLLLDEYGDGGAIVAGGQSLIPMIRTRAATPDCLIDINGLPDQAYIDFEDGQIQIGCLARHADVVDSPVVEEHCPLLAEVAEEIGDRQVRNRGTFCGAIAHADPSGDPPVLATLLNADIVAESTEGTEVHTGDGFYHSFYETDLDKGTLVTEVRFPTLSEEQGAGYEKYEPSEGAYPVATVGALVELGDGVLTDVGIVTGAVEPGPVRVEAAQDILIGEEPTEEVVTEAAEATGEGVNPIGDSEGSASFKAEMTKTLTKRALQTAIDRAGGTQ